MKTKTFTCNLKRAFHLFIWCIPVVTTALVLSLWMSNGFAQCIINAPVQCGPGSNWMQNCLAGYDTICTQPQASISDGQCNGGVNFTMLDEKTIIQRSGSMDIPYNGKCGSAVGDDGINDVIETEIISLNATDGIYTLQAGQVFTDLPPSKGKIVQLPTDPTKACSFFEVFFKITGPDGTLYNHDALVLKSFITQTPPLHDSLGYTHIDTCIKLYPCPVPETCDFVARLTEANHGVCKLTTHIHTPAVYVGGDLHFSVYIKHVLSRPATTPITFKIADMNGNIVYSRATGDYTLNQGDELSFNDVIKLPSNLTPGTYFLMFDIWGMSDPLAKGQLFTIKN